jgi:hypothetical protein
LNGPELSDDADTDPEPLPDFVFTRGESVTTVPGTNVVVELVEETDNVTGVVLTARLVTGATGDADFVGDGVVVALEGLSAWARGTA